MYEKERTSLPTPPPSQYHLIFILPSLPLQVYIKLIFFACSWLSSKVLHFSFLTTILCHFFLNLSHIFRLFAATLFSIFLILLTSFRKLIKDKNPCFLALYIYIYIYNLNKSNMWFWIRKVLSIWRKPKMAVCSVYCEKWKESVK